MVATAQEREGSVAEGLGPVLGFMRFLWALDHGLVRASKSMKAQLGITGPQRLVIRLVGRHPGISAGELAGVLHLHPSTLTGVLKRLVSRGILQRGQDVSDARRALFRLTARGRRIDTQKAGTAEAAVRRALSKLRPRDVAAAERVLAAIAGELK